MTGDGERWLSMSAAMRRGMPWTLAMLSSRAAKAVRPMLPPRLAADGEIPPLHRRKQRCSTIARRGVGTDGDRANAKQAVGTIGATERTMGVTERTRRPAIHRTTADRRVSTSFSRFELTGLHWPRS